MDTITVSFEFIREAFKPYMWSITAIAGPYILVAAIAFGVFYQDLTSSSILGVMDESFSVLDIVIPASIAYSALIIASMMMYATTYAFLRYSQRERRYPDLAEVREELAGKIGMVISSTIVIVLIELAALLFFIVPGIWLSVPMSLVVVIRFNEGIGFSQAVSRAFTLVRDHWWWTFGILILCYLAESIAGGLVGMPLTILTLLGTLSGAEAGQQSNLMSLAIAILTTISQLANFYFSTIIAICTASVYYNHVERLEATQLSERVAALSGEGTP